MRWVAFAAALVLLAASPAHAQTFEGDPTAGLDLPMSPLEGEQDATATVVNPAGLGELPSWNVVAAFTGLDGDTSEADGGGYGIYAATPFKLPFLPLQAVGIALEKLLPPTVAYAPDAGRPLRLSLSYALKTDNVAFGLAWHHFADASAESGLDTFDAGMTFRFGAWFAAGGVVRNIFAPVTAGLRTTRRYDCELDFRPLSDDRLEIAAGYVVSEAHGDVAPRLRASVKLTRGMWLRAEAEARMLEELYDPADPAGTAQRKWDGRASLGLDISFGEAGVAAYATGAVGTDGKARMAGGTFIARVSHQPIPSFVAGGEHITRFRLSGAPTERQLAHILSLVRSVEHDDSVRAVFVQIEGMSSGWATLQELRDAFSHLRAHGKPVFAYLVAGGTRDYYLAAAATKVYLDASGGLRMAGMSSTAMFFKDVFDKLGVVAQFEKIEEYKSAPEAFTRDTPSPKSNEMRESLLDDVYARVVGDLVHDRGHDQATIEKTFDDGPYTAAEAGAAHLVDAVVEAKDVDRLMALELGDFYPVEDVADPTDRPESWARPQIAVVLIEGDIVDGKSVDVPLIGQKAAGGETIAQAIAWARDNSRVAAIVLRINSPGGSALASEVIAREVAATRGKKPIIVSMGDVAASGGYFAAAPADIILADPSTITGSIGIFTGKFDLSGLLGRIGITWDTIRRGPHADEESYLRPYTDEERVQIKQKLRYYYMRFVSTVARGRNLTEAQVDDIARGHVWTGAQARLRHLVDRFGGLADALALAKQRGGLAEDEPAELVILPAAPNPLQEVMNLVGGGSLVGASENASVVPAPLKALFGMLPVSILVEPDAVQARLPFTLVDE